jgi:hypothetical protein
VDIFVLLLVASQSPAARTARAQDPTRRMPHSLRDLASRRKVDFGRFPVTSAASCYVIVCRVDGIISREIQIKAISKVDLEPNCSIGHKNFDRNQELLMIDLPVSC